jgi:hypothetical protein
LTGIKRIEIDSEDKNERGARGRGRVDGRELGVDCGGEFKRGIFTTKSRKHEVKRREENGPRGREKVDGRELRVGRKA